MFRRIVLFVFALTLAVVLAGTVFRRIRSGRRAARHDRLRREFHRCREWLEAEFLKRAGSSGRPRGLAWVECDFDDSVTFACDRSTGHLRALVGVTIRFEAVRGGDMEGVRAVGDLRAATAVFRYDGRNWSTDGRTVFNLSPAETIRHFEHELRSVE